MILEEERGKTVDELKKRTSGEKGAPVCEGSKEGRKCHLVYPGRGKKGQATQVLPRKEGREKIYAVVSQTFDG